MDVTPNYGNVVGKSEQVSINNNYKFDAMLRAIDFFSQKFDLPMLIDFADDFVNEILTLGSSALFLLDQQSDEFVIKKSRLYDCEMKTLPNTKNLQDIAALYGTIITKNFMLFFPEKFIEQYKPALLIPLIRANQLIGFIVTVGKVFGEFEDDDYNMAIAIMHLFNDSFERNKFIEELSAKEKKLDNKIFELYTVNKASKIMFSEINLQNLLTVSVEVFSEVSGSMLTTFGTRNSSKNTLEIRSYKDAKAGTKCPENFSIECKSDATNAEGKYIFHLGEDLDFLRGVFVNPERFNELDAEYVVLIVKDKILGFVTLGKEKIGACYSDEVLELINSLAISCFIALNNAMLFDEIINQKTELEKQYNNLLKLTNPSGF